MQLLLRQNRRWSMQTFPQKQNQVQKPISSSITQPNMAPQRPDHSEHPILHLQRTVGNQALLRMLQTHNEEPDVGLTAAASSRFGRDFSRIPAPAPAAGRIQAKLTVNTPGDIYEQEADAVAEQVMRLDTPLAPNVQQQTETEKPIQRKTTGEAQGQPAPPIVQETLRSPGQPLDEPIRHFMQPRFGHDF